jgi:hypothetical protein
MWQAGMFYIKFGGLFDGVIGDEGFIVEGKREGRRLLIDLARGGIRQNRGKRGGLMALPRRKSQTTSL